MSSLVIIFNISTFHSQSATIVTLPNRAAFTFTQFVTTEDTNMSERQYRVFINASISSRYEVWCQASKTVNPRQLTTGVTNLY